MAVIAYTFQGCLLNVDGLSFEYSVLQLLSKVVRWRMSVELWDLEGLGPSKLRPRFARSATATGPLAF